MAARARRDMLNKADLLPVVAELFVLLAELFCFCRFFSPCSTDRTRGQRAGIPGEQRCYRGRYVSFTIRNVLALVILYPAVAISGEAAESKTVKDFYITVTANDLYLCGEGFGGIYGCIDEAVSREAKSVVVAASSDATVEAVQELVNAVHAIGFDQVGVATFNESDT